MTSCGRTVTPKFLCEYMAYKIAWFQAKNKSTLFAGFVHIGVGVSARNGTNTVKVMLSVLIAELNAIRKK